MPFGVVWRSCGVRIWWCEGLVVPRPSEGLFEPFSAHESPSGARLCAVRGAQTDWLDGCTQQYCTLLHCTVLYCTVLHFTVLYCTLLHCTGLYWTLLHCNALNGTALHFTALHFTGLHCTVLYCTVLYFT